MMDVDELIRYIQEKQTEIEKIYYDPAKTYEPAPEEIINLLEKRKEERPYATSIDELLTTEEMKNIKPEQRVEAMLKAGMTIIAREDKGIYAGNNEWTKIPTELKPLYEKGNISHGISKEYFLKEKVA